MSEVAQRKSEAEVGTEISKTATVADLINSLHNEARGDAISAVQKACDCGDLLIEQKQDLKHGEWAKWVEANCHFSERTAQHYMKASKIREEHGGDLPFSSLRGLYGPAPDTPEKVDKDDANRSVLPPPTQIQADVLNLNTALEEMQLPMMSADAFVSEAGCEFLSGKSDEVMEWLVELRDMIMNVKTAP